MSSKPRQPRYRDIFRNSDEQYEEACQAWSRAIAHLEDRGWLTDARIEIADRYARACAEYHALYPEAVATGPVKQGPNGGDLFNFAWTAVEKLNDRIAKFEVKLGMDVSATADASPPKQSKATAADDYL